MLDDQGGKVKIDKVFMKRLLALDDEVAAKELLKMAQTHINANDWLDLIGAVLYHLSIEVLLDQSDSHSSVFLHRLVQLLPSKDLDPRWTSGALACLSRAPHPLHPDIFDRVMVGMEADPTIAPKWPCECSSSCCLARRMCEGSSAVDLAIKAYNFSALERILSRRSDASPSSVQAVVPLFRKNPRVFPEVREKTLSVFSSCFPEPSCPELYAAGRLVAILCDARDGVIDSLPVEEVGLCGRAAKPMLSELVSGEGDPILFLLAGTCLSVPGRDVLVRFFVDIKLPVSGTNKDGLNVLEYAVITEPSFWVSQSGTSIASPSNVSHQSSPAATLLSHADSLVTPRFSRSCAHISTSIRCECKLCSKWKAAHPAAMASLEKWLETVTDGRWLKTLLPGYTLLDLAKLGQQSDTKRFRSLIENGADLTVTDSRDNTVLHLVADADLAGLLVGAKANVDALNKAGLTPLDAALVDGDIDKACLLIRIAHASITSHGIWRLACIFETTGEAHHKLKTAIFAANESGIPSSWTVRISEFDLRLSEAKLDAKRKLDALTNSTKSQIESLERKHMQEIRDVNDANAVTELAARNEVTDMRAKLAKTEALLNENIRLKSELEAENAELQRKLRKTEKSKSREVAKREQDRKEFEVENESRECSLCMAAMWDTALMCGHCYCVDCAESLCKTTCPTCAKRTNGKFIKLFNCKR